MRKLNDWPTSNELMTALDAEDARQREALRRHLERERPPMHFTGKQLLWLFVKVAFWAGIGWVLVAGWMAL